jgi:hypothetical protein
MAAGTFSIRLISLAGSAGNDSGTKNGVVLALDIAVFLEDEQEAKNKMLSAQKTIKEDFISEMKIFN